MSLFNDDPDDMTPAFDDLDDLKVEQLLRGTITDTDPRLAELLSQARSLSAGPAPLPSGALAALLAGPIHEESPTSLAAHRWRRRVATLALVSAGSSAALVGAAAANVLPARAQHAVARVVDDVSPLVLPGARTTPHPPTHVKTQHPKVPAPVAHRVPAQVSSPAHSPSAQVTTPPAVAAAPGGAAPTPRTTPTPHTTPHPTGSADGRRHDGRQGTGVDKPQGNGSDHSSGKPTEAPGGSRGHEGSKGKGHGSGEAQDSRTTQAHPTHSPRPSRTEDEGKSRSGRDHGRPPGRPTG